MTKTHLDIQKEFDQLKSLYDEDPSRDTFNALILGRMGTGKTTLAKTCPGPVLVHSFDPGGTRSIRSYVKEGRIMVQKFEDEDGKNPSQHRKWEAEFQRLKKIGFFNHIGTYVIDSVTTFSLQVLNEVLKIKGRAGEVPQLQDYNAQILTVRDYITQMASLPCNFIALGHIDLERDETTGKMVAVPLVTGKLKIYLPMLFDEVYIAKTKTSSKGTDYKLLTQHEGYYEARSRLSEDGLLEKEEEPDIKNLLEKVGMPNKDKEIEKSEVGG